MTTTAAAMALGVGGAGLSRLWDYNRANYMFDVPLLQNKAFQVQNINMSRFALFREDIRDLAALSIDKVQSYLIVNTLKLGFIMTIFFNFDRTSVEVEPMNFLEVQVDTLFAAFFCSSAFWELTSIWFSMHAVIVAQSFMTKFLLQVARIPMPDVDDVTRAAPDSTDFERNFATAFRIPFVGAGVQQEASGQGHQAELTREHSGGTRHTAGAAASRDRTPPVEHRVVAPWDLRLGTRSSRQKVGGLSLPDLLDGCADNRVARGAQEPHTKLFKLLRSNWSPLDLYGKICMNLGTTNLLMGIAFYGLYYFRDTAGLFDVTTSGWLVFATFSLLAWWCMLFELTISHLEHAMLAAAMLGGPVCIILVHWFPAAVQARGPGEAPWMYTVATVLAFVWETVLGWSGVTWRGKWPQVWRSSLFLNVLHREVGPAKHQQEVSRMRPVKNPPDIADVEGSSSDGSEDGSFSHVGAPPLLDCLDAILMSAPLPQADLKAVRRARDVLYEGCRGAGIFTDSSKPVHGFWLALPGNEGKNCWVDPGSKEARNPGRDSPEVTVDELLDASQRVAEQLQRESYTWTEQDMEDLAAYGGDSVSNPLRFEAQFRGNGSGAKRPLGGKATAMYLAGVALQAAMWSGVLGLSCSRLLQEYRAPTLSELGGGGGAGELQAPLAAAASAAGVPAVARRLSLPPPRPWLAAAQLGCDADGGQLVLADASGAFLGHWNGTTWAGPVGACGGPALAADFGPDGRLWEASRAGVRPAPGGTAAAAASCEGWGEARGLAPGLWSAQVDAIALDSSPPPGASLHGLAIFEGRLFALEAVPAADGWRLAGAVGAPVAGGRWLAVALRAGRGLALDERGDLYDLDAASGRWSGPEQLGRSLQWRGLCALPPGGGAAAPRSEWLAVGAPASGAGPAEFWHFSRPAVAAPGARSA